MAFTYDPTTDRGKVRLLVRDSSEATAVFSDAEIDAFLSMAGSDIYLAASYGCQARAAQDATTGGVRLGAYADSAGKSSEWSGLADKYAKEAFRRSGGHIVELQHDQFSYEQLEENKSLRGESD